MEVILAGRSLTAQEARQLAATVASRPAVAYGSPARRC